LAEAEPSATQLFARRAVELWSMIGIVKAEAAERRDDRLSFRLSMIDAALSVAREDEPEPA
jgi:hypothetical protein